MVSVGSVDASPEKYVELPSESLTESCKSAGGSLATSGGLILGECSSSEWVITWLQGVSSGLNIVNGRSSSMKWIGKINDGMPTELGYRGQVALDPRPARAPLVSYSCLGLTKVCEWIDICLDSMNPRIL